MITECPSDLMTVGTAPVEDAVQVLLDEAAAQRRAQAQAQPNDPFVAPVVGNQPLRNAEPQAQEGSVPPAALGDAGRREVAGGSA